MVRRRVWRRRSDFVIRRVGASSISLRHTSASAPKRFRGSPTSDDFSVA